MINSHPYINLKAFILMKIITKDYKKFNETSWNMFAFV